MVFAVPWQVRWFINTGLVVFPVYYVNNNYDFLQRAAERRNRLLRRVTPDRIELRTDAAFSPVKAQEFYSSNGFEDSV